MRRVSIGSSIPLMSLHLLMKPTSGLLRNGASQMTSPTILSRFCSAEVKPNTPSPSYILPSASVSSLPRASKELPVISMTLPEPIQSMS